MTITSAVARQSLGDHDRDEQMLGWSGSSQMYGLVDQPELLEHGFR